MWSLIRRLSLKAVKRCDKLYTCEEWIEEYYENKRSKEVHSIFNGRRVFDPALGELSVRTVAKELGVHEKCVNYYITTGRLKVTRKGHYLVIAREELQRFISEEMEDVEDVAQNA